MPSRANVYEDAEIANAIEEIEALEQSELALASAEEFARGSQNVPLVKDISDPSRLITIYVTETGEPRPVPAWTLEGKNSILRRRNEDGTRFFSAKQPANREWKKGSVLCMLHPDHPRRAELNEQIGLAGKVCPAGHLASTFSLRIHMAHRHSQEWAAIQEYEQSARDEEDRRLRRIQAQAAEIAIQQSIRPEPRIVAASAVHCDECDFIAQSQFGLNAHKRYKHAS